MKTKKRFVKFLRIFSIAYLLFLSLFALDVFEMGVPLWQQIFGFLIHLLPVYVLAFALLISWKKPKVGGILFLATAVAFTMFFNAWKNIATFILMSLIPATIGLLFIVSDIKNIKERG